MQKTFTIKEIRYYLKGCVLHDGTGARSKDYNVALDGAITFLDDKECGIAENLAREKWHIEKRPLDRFVGVPCARISPKDGQQRGASCVIEKVDNKNRKILINDVGRHIWVSTKTFFEKWYWGPRYAVGKEKASKA